MQLHPALVDFRTELERLGLVVVCHGDFLCVRLPLFASVRVHFRGGQLRFDPQFGPVGRSTALMATPLAVVAGVGALAATTGIGVVTFTAAVAGVLAALHDVCRLVLTEGCMTRLQLLWETRAAPADALPIPLHPVAALGEAVPSGAVVSQPRASGERVRSETTPPRERAQ